MDKSEVQFDRLPPQEKSSPVKNLVLTQADIEAQIKQFKERKKNGEKLTNEEQSEFNRIRHILANRESR